MLFIIGIRHCWQNKNNRCPKEQNCYLESLKSLMLANKINKIFEEWTFRNPKEGGIISGTENLVFDNPEISNTKYYQIDPPTAEWPRETNGGGIAKSKIEEIQNLDFRENEWVKMLKNKLKSDIALMIVGEGHIQNKFKYRNEKICLDTPLREKLKNAKIKFEIIKWKDKTLLSHIDEAMTNKYQCLKNQNG